VAGTDTGVGNRDLRGGGNEGESTKRKKGNCSILKVVHAVKGKNSTEEGSTAQEKISR